MHKTYALLVLLPVGLFAGKLWVASETDADRRGLGMHVRVQAQQPTEDDPYVRIPAIDAYYNGKKVWFLHTDVSSQAMAEGLTQMVSYPSHHAPRLGSVPVEHAGEIYVFTNGVSQEGVKPWGGGPFHYQIDIIESVPDDEGYTPLRNPHLVTWAEGAEPRILKSVAELREAERNGELTIERTDVIVNAPVVAWPRE